MTDQVTPEAEVGPHSEHVCVTCGDTFKVWPPVPPHKADQWTQCLGWQCPSYTPTRDPEFLGSVTRDDSAQ